MSADRVSTALGFCTEGHACCTHNRPHDHWLAAEDCPRCEEATHSGLFGRLVTIAHGNEAAEWRCTGECRDIAASVFDAIRTLPVAERMQAMGMRFYTKDDFMAKRSGWIESDRG